VAAVWLEDKQVEARSFAAMCDGVLTLFAKDIGKWCGQLASRDRGGKGKQSGCIVARAHDLPAIFYESDADVLSFEQIWEGLEAVHAMSFYSMRYYVHILCYIRHGICYCYFALIIRLNDSSSRLLMRR